MECLSQWFEENQLVLNRGKRGYVVFKGGAREIDSVVLHGNEVVERHSSIRFLGMMLDEGLAWHDHIDKMCARLSSVIFALRTCSRYCSLHVLLMMYHGLFLSVVRYGITGWGGTTGSNMQRVLRLQKRAVRVITGVGRKRRGLIYGVLLLPREFRSSVKNTTTSTVLSSEDLGPKYSFSSVYNWHACRNVYR